VKRAVVLFVVGICLLGAAGGIFETTYNNYLDHTFHITAEQRGDLELPREFPGFMVAILAGVLFFAGEANMAALASGLIALGMFGLAMLANEQAFYLRMIAFTLIWSTGAHLMIPTGQSLALALSKEGRTGEQLGKLASIRALATIVGCTVVVLNFNLFPDGFPIVFMVGAGIALAAAVAFGVLHHNLGDIKHRPRPRLILKKRYSLFYVLNLLFGARKQVFITFGPWVLIRIFGQPPQTFAKLWIVSTILTVLLLPWVGHLVDRIGEKAVLTADAVLLLVVCLTYGFARDVLPGGFALVAACSAYVVDQILFPVQMARTVYLSHIADSKQDVTATLGMGVSINHAVTIPIAMIGGRLWTALGYRSVFIAAACIALLTLFVCRLIKVPQEQETIEVNVPR